MDIEKCPMKNKRITPNLEVTTEATKRVQDSAQESLEKLKS